MAEITLHIVTPKCTYGPFPCDSIHLTASGDVKGRGGGSCGIRKGHAKSLISLDAGTIQAFDAGETILEGKSGCGFATVDKNIVTAVVENFEMKDV